MSVLQALSNADRRLLMSMQQSESWLSLHSRAISRTADGPLYLAAGLYAYLILPGGGALCLKLFLAFSLERLLYWGLKNGLRRKRPADALPGFKSQIVAADEFSFPSGHTSCAFLFATAMVMQFGFLALPMYGWAFAVGASRVFLGVHFPLDTLMGAALGTSIACLFWLP